MCSLILSGRDFALHPVHRWLQSTSTTSDAAVLRATFLVYGSLLLGMFISFCFVRRKFQRVYQVRNWVSDIKVRRRHAFFPARNCKLIVLFSIK